MNHPEQQGQLEWMLYRQVMLGVLLDTVMGHLRFLLNTQTPLTDARVGLIIWVVLEVAVILDRTYFIRF